MLKVLKLKQHGKSLDVPEKTRLQLLEEGWISRHYLKPHGSALEKQKLMQSVEGPA